MTIDYALLLRRFLDTHDLAVDAFAGLVEMDAETLAAIVGGEREATASELRQIGFRITRSSEGVLDVRLVDPRTPERSPTFRVQVHARSEELPEGMRRLLDLLESENDASGDEGGGDRGGRDARTP